MSKPQRSDPPVEIELSIPQSVLTRVELALVDPVRGKPAYGARSKLVTRLLKDWLDRLQRGKVDVTQYTGGV